MVSRLKLSLDTIMQTCSKCNVEKPFSEFNFRKQTNSYRKDCKSCRSKNRKRLYAKNKEVELEQARERYIQNKDAIRKRQAEYYQNNKHAYAERAKKWIEENPDKHSEMNRRNQRLMRKRPYYKYREMLRSLVRRLDNTDKESLGYTLYEFKAHMEKLFTDGMSWDNHGEWEIDHIKPVSAFYKEGITCPKIVNALSNLQPLWKSDNRKKSSKWVD